MFVLRWIYEKRARARSSWLRLVLTVLALLVELYLLVATVLTLIEHGVILSELRDPHSRTGQFLGALFQSGWFLPSNWPWPVGASLFVLLGIALYFGLRATAPYAQVSSPVRRDNAPVSNGLLGSILKFETIDMQQYAQFYNMTSAREALKAWWTQSGEKFNVHLEIENPGPATRVKSLHFLVRLPDGSEVECIPVEKPWPPPEDWQLSDYLTLDQLKGRYLKGEKVYHVFFQVVVPANKRVPAQIVDKKSFEVRGEDSEGHPFTIPRSCGKQFAEGTTNGVRYAVVCGAGPQRCNECIRADAQETLERTIVLPPGAIVIKKDDPRPVRDVLFHQSDTTVPAQLDVLMSGHNNDPNAKIIVRNTGPILVQHYRVWGFARISSDPDNLSFRGTPAETTTEDTLGSGAQVAYTVGTFLAIRSPAVAQDSTVTQLYLYYLYLDGGKIREREAAFYYDIKLQTYIGLRLDHVKQRDVLRDTGRKVCGYDSLRKQYG